jgi:hypothetical protein
MGLDSGLTAVRAASWLKGLPPITRTKLPAANLVAFRVPPKPLDPRRARVLAAIEAPAVAASLNEKELNMKIQMIPLSQLVPSPDNVRKTGAHEGSESVRRIIGPTNYLAACRRFYAALIRRGVDDSCAVAWR